MATKTPLSQVGFLELAKRTNDGDLMEIAEVMTARAPILEDIPWYQCNQILSEKVNRRTSLPSGTWRKAYSGVSKEASTTQIVVEPTALLEARSEIDEDIVRNADDSKGFRRSEDIAFTEGLAQEMAKTFISGTTQGSPEEINGLQQRLNDLDQTTVMDAGGSGGDTTSIYIVDWGRRKTYGVYPSAAAGRGNLGLSINDKGLEKIEDDSGNSYPFYGYVTQFKWWCGLAVRDELGIGRLANIEVSGDSNLFDEDDLIELLNEGHFNRATTRIYFNQKIKTQAQIKMKDKGNMSWSQAEGLSGAPMLVFDGAICRQMEDNIITNTETAVTS